MAIISFPANKKMDLFKFWACRPLQPLILFKKTKHLCTSICSIENSKNKVTVPSLPGRALTKSILVSHVNHTVLSVCIYTCQSVLLHNSKGLKLFNRSAELLLPTSWGHFKVVSTEFMLLEANHETPLDWQYGIFSCKSCTEWEIRKHVVFFLMFNKTL